jgi:hypothetical protein
MPMRVLRHARFRVLELRQQPVGQPEQILARLREAHRTPFARP